MKNIQNDDEFFHKVFYQAIEDNLRVVYFQIINKLNVVRFRDKDALHFITQRDWKLIETTFKKPTQDKTAGSKHRGEQQESRFNYKHYNRAYYQQIIIKNEVDERTTFLFKQRFLKNEKDIDEVLAMFCQIDNLEQFARFSNINLTPSRIQELFLMCLNKNSFLIAFYLEQHFQITFDKNTIRTLNQSLKDQDSQWYVEMKLYFIR